VSPRPSRTRPAGRLLVGLAALLALCSPGTAFGVSDPLEPINRPIFWFNQQADRYVLEPAAKVWNRFVPGFVQRRISNVFDHLDYPLLFVNTLLQGKLEETAIVSGRFVLNSSAGVLGLFDPAARLGLAKSVEDFGQTLGRWGVPPGPYLVLPLLGPSNLRDGAGSIADAPLRIYRYFIPLYASFGLTALEVVNLRALYFEDIASARRVSLDYYVFVRNAYMQRRAALVRDSTETDAEDLYEFDDEEE
jgi:phospholipid-binding lipoprotein MlaA